MFYQLIVIAIILSPTVILTDFSNIDTEWTPILLLAFVTTALGHTLFLNSFKKFSNTTASILSSSAPVLGILLGFMFLDEVPTFNTLIGGSLIVFAVVLKSIRSQKSLG